MIFYPRGIYRLWPRGKPAVLGSCTKLPLWSRNYRSPQQQHDFPTWKVFSVLRSKIGGQKTAETAEYNLWFCDMVLTESVIAIKLKTLISLTQGIYQKLHLAEKLILNFLRRGLCLPMCFKTEVAEKCQLLNQKPERAMPQEQRCKSKVDCLAQWPRFDSSRIKAISLFCLPEENSNIEEGKIMSLLNSILLS